MLGRISLTTRCNVSWYWSKTSANLLIHTRALNGTLGGQLVYQKGSTGHYNKSGYFTISCSSTLFVSKILLSKNSYRQIRMLWNLRTAKFNGLIWWNQANMTIKFEVNKFHFILTITLWTTEFIIGLFDRIS